MGVALTWGPDRGGKEGETKIGRFRGLGGPGRPGTPLDRRSPPRTSICTKNQPRRPILSPFRDHFIFFSLHMGVAPTGGAQIERENPGFWWSGRHRGPRYPLRSTGPAPHINLHKKSAPETNSKAISRRFPVGQKIIYQKPQRNGIRIGLPG